MKGSGCKGYDFWDPTLFRNGKQISKAHPSPIAAATEAFEHGAVVRWSGDFTPGSGIALADGYEVKEVEK